jgi:hypothetical protein
MLDKAQLMLNGCVLWVLFGIGMKVPNACRETIGDECCMYVGTYPCLVGLPHQCWWGEMEVGSRLERHGAS